MIGLSTRQKLHAAAQASSGSDHRTLPTPDQVRWSDAECERVNGRASDVLRRHALPDPNPLGTPMQAARIQAARREKWFRRAARLGMILVVLLFGASMGYHAKHQREREAVNTGIDYRVKAARLAVGARTCELDPHEGCLVCMHKDASGMPSVSTHC